VTPIELGRPGPGSTPEPESKDARRLAPLTRGLFATIILAGLIAAAAVWLGWRTKSDDQWVSHTFEVRSALTDLLSLVQGAEAAQRGYLLTGGDLYLAPYQAAVQQLPGLLDRTESLTGDNPRQQQSLFTLRFLIANKMSELRSTIDTYKAGNKDLALRIVASDNGLEMMAQIRRSLDSMQSEEGRLLAERQMAAEFSAWLLELASLAAFGLILVTGLLASRAARTSMTRLAGARDELATSNEALRAQIRQGEQLESQLRQMHKMDAIGQLTGGIAHDFNNMLGAIMAAMELAKRRLSSGDSNVDRFLDGAMEAARRAATLTKRLLAFARQQPLAPQPVDANRLIGNMSDLLRSSLSERIKIEVVAAAGLWTINVDALQLENCILNVAINARDAMPEGGNLTIETGNGYLDEVYCSQNPEIEPGQFAMIAVTDTGTGMTPDVSSRAFDPFFTTKAAGNGTGLGLSQVYGFVKQSRGHVKLYSEPGAGTTVKMYFPRYANAADEAPKPLPSPAIRTGDRSEIILVVEDEPLMRRSTAEALGELGYTVYDADNAVNALAILDRVPGVKLLFTDVVMPDMNGKKLADEALRRRPHLKVIYTTGYTANAVVHGGVLDSGINFISKPFTLEQLAAKIRTVLDQ
jgi:signal transduction histidine kinase/CheY-like chemotaxis protein